MGKASRDKGKRGERELASELRQHGYNCRRGQQFCGSNGDADVVGLPGIHIECKRVERLNLYDAMAQAKADSKGDLPAVFHRKNNCKWVVIMKYLDWIKMLTKWFTGQDEPRGTIDEYISIKFVEKDRFNVYKELSVSREEGMIYAFCNVRKSTGECITVMTLEDWMEIYKEWEADRRNE
ncbi:hypothetical protein M2149_000813 [Lachnospiraceae bacterium PFB1-21]